MSFERLRALPLSVRWILVLVGFDARADTFQNPINHGADPWMVYYQGNYYLTTTQDNSIRMWSGATVGELKTSPAHLIWRETNSSRSRGIWAPEFHLIDGRWYMYYTATSADNADDRHRLFVLESDGSDPLGPYHFKARLFNPANDQYAIDPTFFQNSRDGKRYLLWAARPGHVLYIARMANPYTLAGNGVSIPSKAFGCGMIHEGPEILQRNGRIFLVYSMCPASTPDYKLGMLIASDSADLLQPSSWKQYPRPIFQRADAVGVYGPGHNGFFKSPNGKEDWIVYHAKSSPRDSYYDRTTRVQRFNWNADGTPNFGLPLPLSVEINEPAQ